MKNVIITGANSGLGFETAKKIAKDPAYRVILACRNPEKAADAKEKIVSETGNANVETMTLDTSLLSSVRTFAEEYKKTYGTVDALVNNAGISPMHGGMTEEGFELVFATNYLGHFLLTLLLLPSMAADARIFNVTSDMHNPPGGSMEWKGTDYLAYEAAEDRRRYSYSKLCAIYFTHALNRLFEKKGLTVTANSFNPGYMAATNFSGPGVDKARSLVVKTTMPERYGELASSSDALAQVVTDPAFARVTNEYFDRSTNTKQSSELSYDQKNEEELWKASLGYCGLSEDEI